MDNTAPVEPIKVGDFVNYCLPNTSSNPGAIRLAVVVAAWSQTCLNLQAFVDGTNDGNGAREAFVAQAWKDYKPGDPQPDLTNSVRYPSHGTAWVTSANEGEPGTPGTWHRRT